MPKHKPNKIWIDADACPKAVCNFKIDNVKVLDDFVVDSSF